MILDKDLLSVQESRELVNKAFEAQQEYKHYSQQDVNKIVKAMAEAGYAESERLAKMAVEESGFGKWEDKLIKNQFGTKDVYESIKNLKTVGIIGEEANGKVLKIAVPMGVVAALVPSTNPTSTAMFKAIISLKGRNAIVASPHPRTQNCTLESLNILSNTAESVGAPKGLIQCLSEPTIEGTDALMKNKKVAVILATGSNPMVKAAYSSGTPAYGVGSGNVPAFIEKTANYKKAVQDILSGTTFDNGTLCSSEQSIIVDESIEAEVRQEVTTQGGYFVNAVEKAKLAKAIQTNFRINPEIVGQSAEFIAKYAGFSVPQNTRVLLADCHEVGKSEPLSMEKLSPILAYYKINGWLEGCHTCVDLLNFGGIGHTMVIHSNDQPIIMKFALEKPSFRVLVNTVASLGAVGYTTALAPSMTLGPGTWGGSIISENVTAKHLINVKSLAFEVNPVNEGKAVSQFDVVRGGGSGDVFMKEIEDRLKARAGNLPLKDSYQYDFDSSVKNDDHPKPKGKVSFGSGISEEEILKIIDEFKS